MAFIDVDEFLLPRQADTIEEALRTAGGFPNVSLPWHMFGTSGHKAKPDGAVVMNYTMRSADPLGNRQHSTNFKCIVDPCEVVEISVHQFKTREFGDLTVNDTGRRFSRDGRKSAAFYSNASLQLNHYYSKSEEEMRRKVSRGWSYAANRQKLEEKMAITVANIEMEMVEDKAMVEFVRSRKIDLGG